MQCLLAMHSLCAARLFDSSCLCRKDAEEIARLLASEKCKFVLIHQYSGFLRPLNIADQPQKYSAVILSRSDLADEATDASIGPIFLGLDANGNPYFGASLTDEAAAEYSSKSEVSLSKTFNKRVILTRRTTTLCLQSPCERELVISSLYHYLGFICFTICSTRSVTLTTKAIMATWFCSRTELEGFLAPQCSLTGLYYHLECDFISVHISFSRHISCPNLMSMWINLAQSAPWKPNLRSYPHSRYSGFTELSIEPGRFATATTQSWMQDIVPGLCIKQVFQVFFVAEIKAKDVYLRAQKTVSCRKSCLAAIATIYHSNFHWYCLKEQTL